MNASATVSTGDPRMVTTPQKPAFARVNFLCFQVFGLYYGLAVTRMEPVFYSWGSFKPFVFSWCWGTESGKECVAYFTLPSGLGSMRMVAP